METAGYRQILLGGSEPRAAGFALWYKDQQGADHFFDMIRSYFEEVKSERCIHICFSRKNSGIGAFTLEVEIIVGERELSVESRGIPARYVLRLCDSLKLYPYIFILAGFTAPDGRDHLLRDCSYSTSAVLVDEDMVFGSTERPFPVLDLKAFFEGLDQ